MHSDDVVISVRNVSKVYRLFDHPGDRVKQFVTFGMKKYHREFTALRDISFEVRRGEAVGVIGRNGAGKSTLLQIICGILKPTQGSVAVRGRIAALLELGAGFNPEFTGRENVYFQGSLMGFSRAEMDERFDEVAGFAEIGDYIDHPVRTYSSGMYVRLAFSIYAVFEPDILIIDEALGVGDLFFQQKCLARIRSLCDEGMTLVFVSHDTRTVRDFCRRTFCLQSGELVFDGDTPTALRHYFAARGLLPAVGRVADSQDNEELRRRVGVATDRPFWRAKDIAGEQRAARIIEVLVSDHTGVPSTEYLMGSVMKVRVTYEPASDTPTHVNLELSNKYNQVVTSLGSSRLGLQAPVSRDRRIHIFEIAVTLNVEAGQYSLCLSLGRPLSPNRGELLDTTGQIGPILVFWNYEHDVAPFLGICGLPASATFMASSPR